MVGTIFVSTNISQYEEGTRTYIGSYTQMLGKQYACQQKGDTFRLTSKGTARDDSDWDILIILDKEELLPSDYDNVTYPLTELGWELGRWQ